MRSESTKTTTAASGAEAAHAVAWPEFAAAEPAFAAEVRAAFGAAKHHILATVRGGGSPRVSGTEVVLSGEEMLLGSMSGARKALDLRRDGRMALHTAPEESMERGDAKVGGIAAEVTDPERMRALLSDPGADPAAFHLFRVLISEAVITSVASDKLRIRHWHPGRGLVDTYRDG
ncbi:pyridoxamine 5'-phosphate oxidase family protein [Streptomonospora salina]|uniref:Pyridoxamine 5'-phosphate oxidase N-terminal domain-containing protein n=1 Tax=Streptomonospora salina TaxID=104205 RepID=A0A841ECF1_9ACTN|nr:pyridoxamine 5'-phosphate oxidase family protein [Streptomonospora salina]MBB5997111.1 hypothetical protein [Streptomonospora salina]